MTRYVVDSYAWVEYLDGSAKGAAVERFLEAVTLLAAHTPGTLPARSGATWDRS